MKKALVIGGNGFIGSHLVDGLLQQEWDVTVLDIQERRFGPMPAAARFVQGDLSQSYLVRQALAGTDVVFHLAWATIHEVANRDPAADIHVNLIPSLHLLEACKEYDIHRFVFVSSGGTVYGLPQEQPIAETHPQEPINAYGISKVTLEKYLHMFHHLHGLEYSILRPSVPYGPRQNPLGRQGAVAVFLYRVARGLPITIWGDGSVTRDYFYVSDLVDGLIMAAEHELNIHRIFNIGGSEEISLLRLLQLAEETVGRKAVIDYQPARKFDAPRIFLDTQRARQELNWQPKVSMREGLAQTWAWMSRTFDANE